MFIKKSTSSELQSSSISYGTRNMFSLDSFEFMFKAKCPKHLYMGDEDMFRESYDLALYETFAILTENMPLTHKVSIPVNEHVTVMDDPYARRDKYKIELTDQMCGGSMDDVVEIRDVITPIENDLRSEQLFFNETDPHNMARNTYSNPIEQFEFDRNSQCIYFYTPKYYLRTHKYGMSMLYFRAATVSFGLKLSQKSFHRLNPFTKNIFKKILYGITMENVINKYSTIQIESNSGNPFSDVKDASNHPFVEKCRTDYDEAMSSLKEESEKYLAAYSSMHLF